MRRTCLGIAWMATFLWFAGAPASATNDVAGGKKPKNAAPKAERQFNTLLSGVIVDPSGMLNTAPIPVRIYRNGVRIAELIPENGMFKMDLEGLVDYDDAIDVVIWPDRRGESRHHSGRTLRVQAATAQNVTLKIHCYYRGRRGYPPSRGRTLYINNI